MQSSITLRETYSDRLSLDDEPDEARFTTRISPSVQIAGGGARFRASARYSPSLILHGGRRSDRFVNVFAGDATLEALENFFFVDAFGQASQSFISPFEPQPEDLFLNTENRVETRTFGISPYVRGNLRGLFTYELRNRNVWTRADNRALSDVHTMQWSGRAASPINLFGWSLEFDDTLIEYENQAGVPLERESRLARGRVFLQPYSGLRLHASAGVEENNYNVAQERVSYDIYGAGLLWQPGPRTRIDLEWEERFFGPSHLARITHRTRLTALSASYTRNVGNFQQDLLTLPPGNTAAILDAIFAARIPDPVERQAAIEEFLLTTGTPAFLAAPLSFYTQQVVLRERAEASAGILGARNSIFFTVFAQESEDLLAGLGTAPNDAFFFGDMVQQHGFSVRANHALGPHTALNAGASRIFSEQEAPVAREARTDRFTLSADRRLSPKTTTSLGGSITRFASFGAVSRRRDAVSLFFGLTHRF